MNQTIWQRMEAWWRSRFGKPQQNRPEAKQDPPPQPPQSDPQNDGQETGQNDEDRYVVMDGDDQQVGAFGDVQQAQQAWRDETEERGSIIDMQTKQDVTPRDVRKSQLTQDQLREVRKRAGGRGQRRSAQLPIDLAELTELREQINRKPVPVFDLANVSGQGWQRPTRTVSVTRRKVVIERVRKVVEIEELGPPRPDGSLEVAYPTERSELHPMRSVSDVRHVPTRQLALPPDLRRHRVAHRQLMRRVFEEDVPGPPTVKKRRIWQEVEEPQIHEWTEDVEVLEEPQAQLLEVVLDVSDSMRGENIHLAVALATLVVGGHLDDDSRYFYRRFASAVSTAVYASTRVHKQNLLRQMTYQDHKLGGGTDIRSALYAAAEDVRNVAKKGDQPEILLITDGEDYITASQVHQAIGEDVVLHTVVIGDYGNEYLKAHSSTYYRLFLHAGRVKGSKDEAVASTLSAADSYDMSDDEFFEMLRNEIDGK
jgi:uncharacterized protein YegL